MSTRGQKNEKLKCAQPTVQMTGLCKDSVTHCHLLPLYFSHNILVQTPAELINYSRYIQKCKHRCIFSKIHLFLLVVVSFVPT